MVHVWKAQKLAQCLYRRLIFHYWDWGIGVGKAVRLGVIVGIAVGVAGTGVSLGTTVIVKGRGVIVKGKAVSVNRSVGYGVTVLPGNGAPGVNVGYGVRVAILGTQSNSPTWIKSLLRQFTLLSNPAVM